MADVASLLAGVVRHATTASLDEGVRDAVRRRVFDTLGAGIAAAPMLASGHRAAGHRLAVAGSIDPLHTVREMCSAIRSSELDDIHIASCITAGAAVVPAALVLAAAHDLTDDALIRSVLAGYEVMVRLGLAIDGPHVLRTGVWPSYLVAPLGAAAVAAVAFGLDDRQVGHSMAIAASRATGAVPRSVGEPSGRWFAFGSAATDGILAAAAAAGGFQVETASLEHHLTAASGRRFNRSRLTPGVHWVVTDVDVKPYCTARQAQAAVEAALRAATDVAPREIDAVRVEVPDAYAAMIDRPAPRHRLESIGSAQYQIAAALTHLRALDDVRRGRLHASPTTARLMRVTAVEPASDLSDRYPTEWGARVTVRTGAGRTTMREVNHPEGSAGAGGASWSDLERKQARTGVDGTTRGAVLHQCRHLAARDDGATRSATSLLAATTLAGGG